MLPTYNIEKSQEFTEEISIRPPEWKMWSEIIAMNVMNLRCLLTLKACILLPTLAQSHLICLDEGYKKFLPIVIFEVVVEIV